MNKCFYPKCKCKAYDLTKEEGFPEIDWGSIYTCEKHEKILAACISHIWKAMKPAIEKRIIEKEKANNTIRNMYL